MNYPIINPNADWPLPHAEDQFSHIVPKDSDACASYSAVHCIESQIKFFGLDTQYSERFIAKMSGTTLQGNYVATVLNTILKYGLVLDTDWPEPDEFTWDEYYADIPQSIIDKGQDFLKQWNVSWQVIPAADVPQALLTSPLQVVVSHDTHVEELVNYDTLFDSYPHGSGYTHSTDGVDLDSYYQVLITKKGTEMAFAKKTLNLDGEIGVFVSIGDPSELADLNTVYGTALAVQTDGSIPTDEIAAKK